MNRRFSVFATILTLCCQSWAAASNTNVIMLARAVRSCFPDLAEPWVAGPRNGAITKEKGSQADATTEKIFVQNDRKIRFEGIVLKPEVADYTRSELHKMSVSVSDGTYISDRIDGGRSVESPVIHPDWVVIVWVWQTSEKIGVSAIHKTMPITFSIKATKKDLNLAIDQIKKGTKESAQQSTSPYSEPAPRSPQR